MAFTGKIFYNVGEFAIYSYDTLTQQHNVLTNAHPAMPANVAGRAWGVLSLMADGKILVQLRPAWWLGDEGSHTLYGFTVNQNLDPASVTKWTHDYSWYNEYGGLDVPNYAYSHYDYATAVADPLTGKNWLDWYSPTTDGTGYALTVWDNAGNFLEGKADMHEGWTPPPDLDPVDSDLHAGAFAVASSLSLVDRWIYRTTGFGASDYVDRYNVDTGAWQTSYHPGIWATTPEQYWYLGATTSGIIFLKHDYTQEIIRVVDPDTVDWADFRTSHGLPAYYPGETMTAFKHDWHCPGMGENTYPARMSGIYNFERAHALIGNKLYYFNSTALDDGTLQPHLWELDLDTGDLVHLLDIPVYLFTEEGAPSDIDNYYDYNSRIEMGLLMVPGPSLSITGQIDQTRVRPYGQ